MVRLDKIYTRSGDGGITSLANGERVPKHSLRVECYGSVDESNSYIGLARVNIKKGHIFQDLGIVQNDLFDLGADLASPFRKDKKKSLRITQKQVDRLENTIDKYNQSLRPLTSFVLPGGRISAANLHVARTIVRRAERSTVLLSKEEKINPLVIKYLNQLSDLLFVCARYQNDKGKLDLLWDPGIGINK